MARVRDDLGVLVQRALADLERGRDPLGAAARELLLRHAEVDRVVGGVDSNNIAVLDERDGPADLRLGDDMAYDKAVRSKW